MDLYGHLLKSDDHKKAMDMIASEMLGSLGVILRQA